MDGSTTAEAREEGREETRGSPRRRQLGAALGFPSETEMDSAVYLRGERRGRSDEVHVRRGADVGLLLRTRAGRSRRRAGVGLEALLPLLEHISGVKRSLGNQRLGLLLGIPNSSRVSGFSTPQI